MNYRAFSSVAGAIFCAVAAAHLLRIYMGWPVLIGTWSVPIWLSWIAVFVAGALGYFGFRFGSAA